MLPPHGFKVEILRKTYHLILFQLCPYISYRSSEFILFLSLFFVVVVQLYVKPFEWFFMKDENFAQFTETNMGVLSLSSLVTAEIA